MIGVTRQAVHQRIKAKTIKARREVSTRSARGFFWAVDRDSVEALRVRRIEQIEAVSAAEPAAEPAPETISPAPLDTFSPV